MKRSSRSELATETVAILRCGDYTSKSGRRVLIASAIQKCVDGTQLFEPDELKRLRNEALTQPDPGFSTKIEVVNETTLEGIARLIASGSESVAALNFASAKNPGGGFLNGSQAQEESLARSSALYASLLHAGDYYRRHRDSRSLLYTDAMILSPACPVFRTDDGDLLEEPQLVTFVTSAAPNAGAAAKNRREDLPLLEKTLRRRSELVLGLMATTGYDTIVLGAWGCGVFRNDPEMVASIFAEHLFGIWKGRFKRVLFSVLDRSGDGATVEAFERALSR